MVSYDPITGSKATKVINIEATQSGNDGNDHDSETQTATVSKTPIISLDAGVTLDSDRAVKIDEGMDPADMALMATMWVCFAMSFAIAVSVCAVFVSRRSLVK